MEVADSSPAAGTVPGTAGSLPAVRTAVDRGTATFGLGDSRSPVAPVGEGTAGDTLAAAGSMEVGRMAAAAGMGLGRRTQEVAADLVGKG